MDPARRFAISGLAASAAVSACAPRSVAPALGPPSLDTRRLTQGYAELAMRAHPGVLGFGVGLVETGLIWVSDPGGGKVSRVDPEMR